MTTTATSVANEDIMPASVVPLSTPVEDEVAPVEDARGRAVEITEGGLAVVTSGGDLDPVPDQTEEPGEEETLPDPGNEAEAPETKNARLSPEVLPEKD